MPRSIFGPGAPPDVIFGLPTDGGFTSASWCTAGGRGRPANYYLWVSPDGRGETWTSQTLVGLGGKGYASAVEVAPGKLVYSGYNKKKRALQVWQVNVERTAER